MRSCESKAPYRGGKFVKRAPVVNITRKYARSKGIWEESNGLKWIGIPGYKTQLLLTTLCKNIRQTIQYKYKIHGKYNCYPEDCIAGYKIRPLLLLTTPDSGVRKENMKDTREESCF